MAYRIFWCSELKALKAARITNNNAVQISRCFLAVGKKATGQVPPIPREMKAGTPTGTRRFSAYLSARTSQDCGSSTAQSP
jgi:hypothetical protein